MLTTHHPTASERTAQVSRGHRQPSQAQRDADRAERAGASGQQPPTSFCNGCGTTYLLTPDRLEGACPRCDHTARYAMWRGPEDP